MPEQKQLRKIPSKSFPIESYFRIPMSKMSPSSQDTFDAQGFENIALNEMDNTGITPSNDRKGKEKQAIRGEASTSSASQGNRSIPPCILERRRETQSEYNISSSLAPQGDVNIRPPFNDRKGKNTQLDYGEASASSSAPRGDMGIAPMSENQRGKQRVRDDSYTSFSPPNEDRSSVMTTVSGIMQFFQRREEPEPSTQELIPPPEPEIQTPAPVLTKDKVSRPSIMRSSLEATPYYRPPPQPFFQRPPPTNATWQQRFRRHWILISACSILSLVVIGVICWRLSLLNSGT